MMSSIKLWWNYRRMKPGAIQLYHDSRKFFQDRNWPMPDQLSPDFLQRIKKARTEQQITHVLDQARELIALFEGLAELREETHGS